MQRAIRMATYVGDILHGVEDCQEEESLLLGGLAGLGSSGGVCRKTCCNDDQ